MNTIYVQSYPVYHDMIDNDAFLELANRDKWMPALTIQRGYPSELWAAGEEAVTIDWQYDTLPSLPVKIFESDRKQKKSRHHTSESLNRSAREASADLFVLKGLDGGVGLHLAKQVLIPNRIPFAVIIGGEWYHPIIRRAAAVLYETEWQRRQLTRRSARFWRTVVDEKNMIRLPKSVETRHFSPDPKIKKEFDVIAMGRLIEKYKNYDALFRISRRLKVGVIGGGPQLDHYRLKYPEITWFGQVPYAEVPALLNKGRLFFHTGLRDHHPRAIAEAAACGVPPVAFSDIIHEDVIPDYIGLRVSRTHFPAEITELLDASDQLDKLSRAARAHAVKNWHYQSSRDAIRELANLMHATRT